MKLMQTLVLAQIKAGDFSGAAAAARFVRLVGPTDRALRDVAAAQARSGDLRGALALVSDRDYGVRKAYIWLGAARGLADRGRKTPPPGVQVEGRVFVEPAMLGRPPLFSPRTVPCVSILSAEAAVSGFEATGTADLGGSRVPDRTVELRWK